jgi:hypothetical protein
MYISCAYIVELGLKPDLVSNPSSDRFQPRLTLLFRTVNPLLSSYHLHWLSKSESIRFTK